MKRRQGYRRGVPEHFRTRQSPLCSVAEHYSPSCIDQRSWMGRHTVIEVWEHSRSRVMIRDMERVVEQESRIRQLCAEAAAAQEPEALRPIMKELKTLLHEQNEERKLIEIEYPIFLDDLRKRAA